MLYRAGKTAFQSAGGDVATQFAYDEGKSSQGYADCCKKQINGSFNELSKGLAGTWSLSDLLIKALEQPTTHTNEI